MTQLQTNWRMRMKRRVWKANIRIFRRSFSMIERRRLLGSLVSDQVSVSAHIFHLYNLNCIAGRCGWITAPPKLSTGCRHRVRYSCDYYQPTAFLSKPFTSSGGHFQYRDTIWCLISILIVRRCVKKITLK